jgi:hypothetical protein
VESFLVTFLLVTATMYITLVACYAVLVRFDAAQFAVAETAHVNPFVWERVCACVDALALVLLPSERKVCRGNNLDKVHVIESALVGVLFGSIEGIDMVTCPHAPYASHGLDGALRNRRTEAQLVNLVSEAVPALVLEVVLQIVDVHVAV